VPDSVIINLNFRCFNISVNDVLSAQIVRNSLTVLKFSREALRIAVTSKYR
jgi:hypothetical protein